MRVICIFLFLAMACITGLSAPLPKLAPHEVTLKASGEYANPYTDVTAEAALTEPGTSKERIVPLFWDGGQTWKFRFAPDRTGTWTWQVRSKDKGLEGQSGNFTVVDSGRKGSLRPRSGFPHHFERQDGSRFWFLGDTAWALFMDNEKEKHNREAAQAYIKARASQGFNVLHSALLSEAGWENRGGPPFTDLASEKINPGYWQEIDTRVEFANTRGMICGLALAWGDKRRQEPFAWRRFPGLEARKRYARYVAARYSAYDVYFLVAGEWHAEIRARDSTEAAIKQEFIELGDALEAADPHGRMIGIHPMTSHGSVREFNAAPWMSFADYQQNYRQLHERILQSRSFAKPVVNGEYGYFLRDQNGDGAPDKDNSTSVESMRHATWDILMAGGYVVTGFGTTYFGGNRDPGPFDWETAKNKIWEQQIGYTARLFTAMEWWKLQPHDELVRCDTPRGSDTTELKQAAPPKATYWCLAEPGRQYVLYTRGISRPVTLELPQGPLRQQQFNPRTGEFTPQALPVAQGRLQYVPPDQQDWLLVLAEGKP